MTRLNEPSVLEPKCCVGGMDYVTLVSVILSVLQNIFQCDYVIITSSMKSYSILFFELHMMPHIFFFSLLASNSYRVKVGGTSFVRGLLILK